MSKTRSAPVAPPTRKHLARAAREARQRRYILIGTMVVVGLVLAVVGYGLFDQTVLRPRQAVARVGDHNITRGPRQVLASRRRNRRRPGFAHLSPPGRQGKFGAAARLPVRVNHRPGPAGAPKPPPEGS